MGVGEGELLDRAIDEVHVFSIGPCRLSLFHHSRSGVYPDELGIRTLFDHATEELPGPASHIENHFDGSGVDGGFADRRFLDWSEEEALQDRAVIVRRPAIEVADVSILCHLVSVGAANVHCKVHPTRNTAGTMAGITLPSGMHRGRAVGSSGDPSENDDPG